MGPTEKEKEKERERERERERKSVKNTMLTSDIVTSSEAV